MCDDFISEETYGIVMANAARLDAAIVHSRDNGLDYFGFKTLERSYLLKIEGLIVERPQVSRQLTPPPQTISPNEILSSISIFSCASPSVSTRCNAPSRKRCHHVLIRY